MLTHRYSEALTFTFEHHHAQVRKGEVPVPYLAYLLSVSSLTLEHGGSETEAIAALLHDTLEDVGDYLRPEILARFGLEVLKIVEDCTDGVQEDKALESLKEGEATPFTRWLERKTHYLAGLPLKARASRLVPLADKVHNARAIGEDFSRFGDALWPRFRAGQWGTLWYYRSLLEGFEGASQGDDFVGLLPLFRGAVLETEERCEVMDSSTADLLERARIELTT